MHDNRFTIQFLNLLYDRKSKRNWLKNVREDVHELILHKELTYFRNNLKDQHSRFQEKPQLENGRNLCIKNESRPCLQE